MTASTVTRDAQRVLDEPIRGRKVRPGCEEDLGLGVAPPPPLLSPRSATPALTRAAVAVLDMPPSPLSGLSCALLTGQTLACLLGFPGCHLFHRLPPPSPHGHS